MNYKPLRGAINYLMNVYHNVEGIAQNIGNSLMPSSGLELVVVIAGPKRTSQPYNHDLDGLYLSRYDGRYKNGGNDSNYHGGNGNWNGNGGVIPVPGENGKKMDESRARKLLKEAHDGVKHSGQDLTRARKLLSIINSKHPH